MPAGTQPRCVDRRSRTAIPPGTLVRLDTTDPTVDVRLARFSHGGVPVHTIDRPDGRYVPIPGDAQGPTRAPDYRVLTSPAVTLSTCR
jgi:hypothetical protein